ncbi:MAG TPA: hypothetical protein VHT28_08815 [Silvibacterium sp.]|nr:hypothetical protein [Silvibacterium sp.]
MKNPLRTIIRIRRGAGWLAGLVLIFLLAVHCTPIHSQTTAPTASLKEKPMKHYALIFHTTRPFTPEEQQRRGPEILAWVKTVTDKGITLDPRNFGETAGSFSQEQGGVVSSNGSTDPALATIVFFDSPSKEQALEIARIHPGLHYGVTVEVREWNSPRAPVATP